MSRIFLMLFLFVGNGIGVLAQQGYDTIPYALDHHNQRLEKFEREPMVKNAAVFIGDSQIEFGNWQQLLKEWHPVNRGIAGDNTFGILARLQNIISMQPAKVFIEAGINDISQNVPVDKIANNIFEIVRQIKAGSKTTTLYVTSLLPTNDAVKIDFPELVGKNDLVVSLNEKLRTNASRLGYVYLDLYSHVKTDEGKLDIRFADADGLHLNIKGYQLWTKLIRELK